VAICLVPPSLASFDRHPHHVGYAETMLAYPDDSTSHSHVRRKSMRSQAETSEQRRVDSKRLGCEFRRAGLAFECRHAAARHERGPRQVLHAFRVLGPNTNFGDKPRGRLCLPSAQNSCAGDHHHRSIALGSFAAPSSTAHDQAVARLPHSFPGTTAYPCSPLDHLPSFTDRILSFEPCHRFSHTRLLHESTHRRRLMVVSLWSNRLLRCVRSAQRRLYAALSCLSSSRRRAIDFVVRFGRQRAKRTRAHKACMDRPRRGTLLAQRDERSRRRRAHLELVARDQLPSELAQMAERDHDRIGTCNGHFIS
jgi:hypothetical protein